MKVVVALNDINNIDEYIKIGVNTFIFGLKGYSTLNCSITMEKTKEIIKKYKNIDFFISMNKNIFNNEINDLQEKLLKLDKLRIKGVLFYDLSILQIKSKNNLNIDLVWNQTHMVTNYNTCNYYYDKGVKYGRISSELTIDEILEINKNSKMKFMTLIVGHPVMSYSKRNLISNYLKSSNENKDTKQHIISESDKTYFINENYTGTSIIYGNVINGTSCIKELLENNFSYVIFKEEYMDKDIFKKVLKLTLNYMENLNDNLLKEIEDLIGNDTNFFYKKTIYKVKKEV